MPIPIEGASESRREFLIRAPFRLARVGGPVASVAFFPEIFGSIPSRLLRAVMQAGELESIPTLTEL